MANLKLRYLTTILLLIASASLVHSLQYDSSQDETAGLANLQKIPMQIGEWQGYDLPLDESVYEILETRAIIHRNYVNKARKTILLSIVHYSDTKVGFHAPEACLGGRGERAKKQTKKITIISANNSLTFEIAEILASNVNSKSVSYYFYKAGNFVGQNYIKMRLNIARNSLLGEDKSGSLIRFSGNFYNEDDQQQIEEHLEAFMKEIMPLITD